MIFWRFSAERATFSVPSRGVATATRNPGLSCLSVHISLVSHLLSSYEFVEREKRSQRKLPT